MRIKIQGGVEIRLQGKPNQEVDETVAVRSIALLGEDYPGLRPIINVAAGQRVRAGERLFTDRRRPGLVYTAPVAGTVRAIAHGRRRSLDSIVIDVEGDEAVEFERPAQPDRMTVQSLLMASGGWQALRTRPFGRIADAAAVPDAVFVTAIDTAPLAGDPAPVIRRFETWFRLGAGALRHLTDGSVYVCQAADASLPDVEGTTTVRFSGRHPAGLPSTHIHHIHPVGEGRMVWHIGYQDVIAIGCLLDTGRIWTRRVIALTGPGTHNPRLALAPPGANLRDLFGNGLTGPAVQLLSGSPLGGAAEHFLRRYDVQAAAIPHQPPPRRSLLSRYLRPPDDERAPPPLIPNAVHERAAPCAILPAPFLRAISTGDAETAAKLGALELVEEDLALLNYVDGSGTDYGALLRATLDELEDRL
ncbi:hypothetical protein NOF55_09875 [Rhizobiaceae bacterium BDR2-2]|uniref:Na(+)-translocating NADH-quinone reductase subunit A n=1 Tax=Ectorhizobium quercum TaxID=2965071 RepID=A0AAE3SUN2_9HYPH|nr:hypothetical protein [Ectorhizobium quercum]MCX8997415.1 hypothetical protein [Ectorhizobium quercum]